MVNYLKPMPYQQHDISTYKGKMADSLLTSTQTPNGLSPTCRILMSCQTVQFVSDALHSIRAGAHVKGLIVSNTAPKHQSEC